MESDKHNLKKRHIETYTKLLRSLKEKAENISQFILLLQIPRTSLDSVWLSTVRQEKGFTIIALCHLRLKGFSVHALVEMNCISQRLRNATFD